MNKAQLLKLRDVGITLLIFVLLLTLMIMLNFGASSGIDKTKAFYRSCGFREYGELGCVGFMKG